MVKVRLHGTKEETQEFLDELKKHFCILAISEEYPDRGQSVYVRKYLDCKIKSED